MGLETKNPAAPASADGPRNAAHHDQQAESKPRTDATQDWLVGTIERNARERIHVALSEFRGRDYLDLRIFASYPDGFRPTKQGITIRPAQIPALREILDRAEDEARRRGLL